MAAVLSPLQFRRQCQRIAVVLTVLSNEYEAAYERAYTGQVGECGPIVQDDSPSDITGSVAMSHGRLRQVLHEACELVGLVRSGRRHPPEFFGLEQQIEAIKSSLVKDEIRHGKAFDPVRFPRTAYKDDVLESCEAQARRSTGGDVYSGNDAVVRRLAGMPTVEQEFQRGVL